MCWRSDASAGGWVGTENGPNAPSWHTAQTALLMLALQVGIVSVMVKAPPEDDESAMVAMQCVRLAMCSTSLPLVSRAVRVIGSILYAAHRHPHLYDTLEPVVQPLINEVRPHAVHVSTFL